MYCCLKNSKYRWKYRKLNKLNKLKISSNIGYSNWYKLKSLLQLLDLFNIKDEHLWNCLNCSIFLIYKIINKYVHTFYIAKYGVSLFLPLLARHCLSFSITIVGKSHKIVYQRIKVLFPIFEKSKYEIFLDQSINIVLNFI